VRRLLAATLLAVFPSSALAAGAAKPPQQPSAPSASSVPMGTLAVCNTSGARPITGSLVYSLVAPASAGGSQSVTVPVGTCATQVFYPQGTSVVVTETVPAGYAVTSISIGGGASTISANAPAAGSATVTIGSGQSLLTFVTSGPPRPCKVPAVAGLTLAAARSAIVKAACSVGRVRRVYSSRVRVGRVISQYPKRGVTLAHGAPVSVVVSRGPS